MAKEQVKLHPAPLSEAEEFEWKIALSNKEADLRQKTELLSGQVISIQKELAETKQALTSTIRLLQSVIEAHNNLVKTLATQENKDAGKKTEVPKK